MRKFNLKTIIAIGALVIGISQRSAAQSAARTYSQKLMTLELTAGDSLQGFDDERYKLAAMADGFVGDEFPIYMYKNKRQFIDSKYQLYKRKPGYTVGNGPSAAKIIGGGNQINVAPCVNEDFEATPAGGPYTSISGWTISEGENGTFYNNTYYNTCSVNAMPQQMFTLTPTEFWVRATPIADPNFPGGVPASPLGGTKVAQLNNGIANLGEITKISQTFPVTPSNCLFRYAYAACFNGTGHLCCDQPFLRIRLIDCNNNILPCPTVSVIASGPSCTLGTPGFGTNQSGYLYKNWTQQAIDLTPYINSCITIEVIVGDCSGWAHFGYCYFDALCVPMDIVVNGVTFPAGTNATTVSACGGANQATITAPPGLSPYLWNGPPGSGINNNPNQTIVGNVSGNYTLTMNPAGSCAPVTKTVTLLFAPSPTAGLTYTNACNIYTLNFTGTPTNVVQSYTINGPGVVPSFTSNQLTNVVTFTANGTYTILQVVTNTAGCTASVQSVVNVLLGPNPNFSMSPSPQCLVGNSFTFAAALNTGTQSYVFTPTLGAPPTGNTPNYGPVSFTQPGTYTVTHNITNGVCPNFSTQVIVINPNPVPTATNSSPTCLNTSLTLSATGGTAYSWVGPNGYTSPLQTPTIANAQLTNNGTYTVTVTNSVGCTGTAVTTVTVFTIPSPSIASNAPCVGSVLSLSATGGVNYVWSGPSAFTSTLTNPSINNVQLANAGTYTLLAGTGGCTVATTASITVYPLPSPTISPSSTVCLNQTILLAGNGGTVYTWNGPGGFFSNAQSPSIPNAQQSNGGNYTLTVTDGNGCTNSVVNSVYVAPLPTLSVNNPTACPGFSFALLSSGASNYSWVGPNNFMAGFQNITVPSASVTMTGQYTLTGTSANGCTSTAVSNVAVYPSPVPNIVSNSPICSGSTLNLMGSGGNIYAWTGPNNFQSNIANPSISNASVNASGVYTLNVTSASTCTGQITATIVVNPLPTPSITTNSPLCAGETLSLTGYGANAYNWSGPNNFVANGPGATIGQTGVINTGIYTLVATDLNGCVNATTTAVVINTVPLVSAIGCTVCIGGTGTLNVQTDAPTHNWVGPNNFVSNQQTIYMPNFPAASAGDYTVVVTAANQCTAWAVATIANYPVPTPTASNSGPVCLGDKVNFTSQGGHVYNWFGPNSFISDQQNTTLESANSMDYAGTYTLGVIDDKGCQGFTTTQLIIRALPTATLNTNANKFCVPFCATFNAASSSSLTAIKWQLDGSNNSISNNFTYCFKNVGNYTLRGDFTDMYGCSNTATMLVHAYPVPVADFHTSPGDPIEYDDVQFTDESQGDAINSWTWYFASNYQVAMMQNPTHVFENSGTYPIALVIRNKWGCSDTVVKPIVIGEGFSIYVPNAFTPNGDGLNDIFQPKGYGIHQLSIMVFDRWGERLFSSNDIYKGWDGTYKGQPCKEDVYTWKLIVQGADGKKKEMAGTVSLIK
jgi:gliding motility-associated-like protein